MQAVVAILVRSAFQLVSGETARPHKRGARRSAAAGQADRGRSIAGAVSLGIAWRAVGHAVHGLNCDPGRRGDLPRPTNSPWIGHCSKDFAKSTNPENQRAKQPQLIECAQEIATAKKG